MKKKCSTKLKWIGLTLASVGAIASGSAMATAGGMRAESQGGLKVFTPCDNSFWFALGGRINFDTTIFSGDTQDKQPYARFPNGSNIRRVILKLEGGVGEFYTYNLSLRFNGQHVRFEDAWLGYSGIIDNSNLRIGQFTPPTSIDDWGNYGTQTDTLFLESALATTAFSIPDKVLGLWWDSNFLDTFMLNLAVYHPQQNTVIPKPNNDLSDAGEEPTDNFGNSNKNDRYGIAGRFTYVPVHNDCTVLHFGVLGRYQKLNHRGSFPGDPTSQRSLFSTQPEAIARSTSSLLNTGAVGAKSFNVVGLEALGIWGPIMAEAEYHLANVQRTYNPNATGVTVKNTHHDGFHIQAAYLLTGETRGYDFATGTLRNPVPAGPCGAWEVAARYSHLDLINRDIYGGKQNNITLGLRWFINEHVHLAANYIHASIHPTGIPAGTTGTSTTVNGTNFSIPALNKRELNIFALRLGVVF